MINLSDNKENPLSELLNLISGKTVKSSMLLNSNTDLIDSCIEPSLDELACLTLANISDDLEKIIVFLAKNI